MLFERTQGHPHQTARTSSLLRKPLEKNRKCQTRTKRKEARMLKQIGQKGRDLIFLHKHATYLFTAGSFTLTMELFLHTIVIGSFSTYDWSYFPFNENFVFAVGKCFLSAPQWTVSKEAQL